MNCLTAKVSDFCQAYRLSTASTAHFLEFSARNCSTSTASTTKSLLLDWDRKHQLLQLPNCNIFWRGVYVNCFNCQKLLFLQSILIINCFNCLTVIFFCECCMPKLPNFRIFCMWANYQLLQLPIFPSSQFFLQLPTTAFYS